MKKTLTLTLGLALSPWAAANDDIDLMQQLFQQGQSVEVYEIGQELQSELEGNPKFDYYYGAAAIDSGDASQGVFALERVLIQLPNNQAARLELARGYYELEEYQRSRKEFETVMTANPPDDVKEKVQSYLDAIRLRESRYRSTATAFFKIGAGNDTNANSATDDSQINGLVPQFNTLLTGLGLNTIAASSRAQESSFTDIAAGTNINLPLTKNWSLVGGTDLSATIFNDDLASNFNTTAFNFRGGAQQRIGDKHRLNYQLSHQALILKDDFYRNTSNVTLGWSWSLNDISQVQSYARLGQSEHAKAANNAQDTDSQTFGASYIRQVASLPMQPVFSAGLSFGNEEPQSSSNVLKATLGKDFTGLNLGALLNINNKNSARINLNYQSSEYDGQQVAFGTARDDDTLALNVNYDYLLSRRWKFNAYISHLDNSSNINIYDYDRDRIGVNFTFETK